MKKILTIFLYNCALFGVVNGQITSLKIATITAPTDNNLYDSTVNFLGGNVDKYIGQELYVNNIDSGVRRFGYEGFFIEIPTTFPIQGVYKCCSESNKIYSNYDSLVGKYFRVIEVIKEDLTGDFYLKLKERMSSDIVYYNYKWRYENAFKFIVVGYFTKLKKDYIGKEYAIRYNEYNILWKCVDITYPHG